MSVRSLNKVILIGNLTRDPELRYTPAGTAVSTFGLATNRSWTTQTGETKEETEFHRIVAWNKLAELCSQLLSKGRKVYVEGRLATHSWTAQDGAQRTTTEIVIDDMIILDSKKRLTDETGENATGSTGHYKESLSSEAIVNEINVEDMKVNDPADKKRKKTVKSIANDEAGNRPEKSTEENKKSENITEDDIPF